MNKEVVAPAAEVPPDDRPLKGFKAYEIAQAQNPLPPFNRRDFYKICLLSGESIIHYADKGIALRGTCLFFANPHIPCSMELVSAQQRGFACLFSEAFVQPAEAGAGWQQSPLFASGGTPVFTLSDAQAAYITGIFRQMLAAQGTTYRYRRELLSSYLQLLLHEALRLQPATAFFQYPNAAARVTSLFLELLERQFPIESPAQGLGLKTASEFAERLAIPVSQLNQAVQDMTGQLPAAHLAQRVGREAQALLEYTDWDVAAIAASLGFERPDGFRQFFKQHAGRTPLAFRQGE